MGGCGGSGSRLWDLTSDDRPTRGWALWWMAGDRAALSAQTLTSKSNFQTH